MTTEGPAGLYKRYHLPAEVIVHCVWLYHRFGWSLRDVQEVMAERGVAVTYETIGQWARKFAPAFAALRRRRPRPGDTWHVDEVQLNINGRRNWLWRAVDQHGVVLDILVQTRRNQEATEAFFRHLVEVAGAGPRVLITDKLASYPPAVRRVLPGVDHRRHNGLNNHAENSHQPTRRRERAMQRFKSPEQAQRFPSIFEPSAATSVSGAICFPPPRGREAITDRFTTWRQLTGLL